MNLTYLKNEQVLGYCILNYKRYYLTVFPFSKKILLLWIKMEKLLCTWWYFSGRKDDNKSSFRWKSLLCAFRPLRILHNDSNMFLKLHYPLPICTWLHLTALKFEILSLKLWKYSLLETKTFGLVSTIGQAIGPLWDFCAPISIVVEL